MAHRANAGTTIDALTLEPVSIEHVHEETHSGTRFVASDVATIGVGTTRYYTILVGAKEAHFVPYIQNNNEVVAVLQEGSTVTVNGTPVPLRNRRRLLAASNPALSQAFAGSTVTVDGTVLVQYVLGSTGHAPGGIQSHTEDEVVLAPNTTYTVKITANATALVSVNLDLYEL